MGQVLGPSVMGQVRREEGEGGGRGVQAMRKRIWAHNLFKSWTSLPDRNRSGWASIRTTV